MLCFYPRNGKHKKQLFAEAVEWMNEMNKYVQYIQIMEILILTIVLKKQINVFCFLKNWWRRTEPPEKQ